MLEFKLASWIICLPTCMLMRRKWHDKATCKICPPGTRWSHHESTMDTMHRRSGLEGCRKMNTHKKANEPFIIGIIPKVTLEAF